MKYDVCYYVEDIPEAGIVEGTYVQIREAGALWSKKETEYPFAIWRNADLLPSERDAMKAKKAKVKHHGGKGKLPGFDAIPEKDWPVESEDIDLDIDDEKPPKKPKPPISKAKAKALRKAGR